MIRPVLLFLGVFGPATITAMTDNDAGIVATRFRFPPPDSTSSRGTLKLRPHSIIINQ